MSRYTAMIRRPWRLRAIRALLAAAKWLARPSIRDVKILEHYDLILEVETVDRQKLGSSELRRATLIVQSFEACTIRDAETKEMDELLSNSEAIFLGANNQQEWKP